MNRTLVGVLFGCVLSVGCSGDDSPAGGGGGTGGSTGGAGGSAGAGAGSGAGGGSAASTSGGSGGAGSGGGLNLDPVADDDGDGLSNGDELRLSLDPQSWDSDDDGFADPDEVVDLASPLDSDDDGLIDAIESDLTDNDLDETSDTHDAAQGWQVAAGQFFPQVIANDGKESTRVEVRLSGDTFTRVALQSPANFYDKEVLPDEILVDGVPLGAGELELFDDGTHGDRFAGDNVWSRDKLTTAMAIRTATGGRGWVVFLKLLVTSNQGTEERYLGMPNDQGANLQRVLGFYLGVVDKDAVLQPTAVGSGMQKTRHLLNIVDPAAAVRFKRRFIETGSNDETTVPDTFRPVLEAIQGDVDFVVVFPERSARGSHAGVHFRASADASGFGWSVFPPAPEWGSENDTLKSGLILDFDVDAPLNHELMHYWGVYLDSSFGFDSDLGSHWGIASTNGVLGGFDPETFTDNGDGTYELGYFSPAGNEWQTTRWSPIELYLAGLAPASEVEPILTLQDALPVDYTETHVIVEASPPKTVTIEDIIAEHGERQPSYETSQKAFTAAFAVYSERALSASTMTWLDLIADYFGRPSITGSMTFEDATHGRATMTTELPALVDP